MNLKVKELEAKLPTVEEGEEKVDILNELAWELWTADTPRAIEFTLAGLELAQTLQYEKGLAYARLNEGVIYWQTDVDKAIPNFLDALQWFEKAGDKTGEANTLGLMGIIYWSFGDFERGFDLAIKGLELFKEVQDLTGEGWAYNTLGGFHYDLKDYSQTLSYFQCGLEIFKKIKNRVGQARALNGIGNAYHFMGEYDKALEYQRKSLRILRQIDHKMSESRTLNDIGLIYGSLENYKKALEYHRKSLKMRQELNYPAGESTTLMDLGDIYLKQGKHNEAIEAVNKALLLSKQMKGKPKIARSHSLLARIYEEKGDFKKALIHYKRYHAIEEEVFHEDSDQKLKKMKTAYQIEASQKEAEIYRLRNVELKEKNDQLEQIIQQLNATQAQLLQSGKMAALGSLVAGLVHEINTPIGTIKSSADVIDRVAGRLENGLKAGGLPEEPASQLRDMLQFLQQNNQNSKTATERILKILQSLKNFSRLDEAKFQKASIHEGLESTLTLIEHEIKEKIKVVKEYDQLPQIYFYPDQLNQVFMNLLLNAVQATAGGGSITIKTYSENGQACIKISDTGRGIPADKLERLFEPGFTSERSRVKMRTGLYTTYNIVSQHKGEISVESEIGRGTTFTVSLPMNLNELVASANGAN